MVSSGSTSIKEPHNSSKDQQSVLPLPYPSITGRTITPCRNSSTRSGRGVTNKNLKILFARFRNFFGRPLILCSDLSYLFSLYLSVNRPQNNYSYGFLLTLHQGH